ncbi:MAG TPA: cytochrome C oxidase subunit IV family protein [Ferruginibacter sp.]|nr:cytochrome C oxidase subunit IV family protein [Ferruginibacter sp.]
MSNHSATSEITFEHAPAENTSRIWKVFWLLSFLTAAELLLGYGHARHWYGGNEGLILFVKGVICILTAFKAYYIVSVFMHLGDEVRNLIMTIVTPLILFVWFIIAFLWDGDSWKTLRNTDAHSRPNIENIKHHAPASAMPGEKP